jgi:hypothetical protein
MDVLEGRYNENVDAFLEEASMNSGSEYGETRPVIRSNSSYTRLHNHIVISECGFDLSQTGNCDMCRSREGSD